MLGFRRLGYDLQAIQDPGFLPPPPSYCESRDLGGVLSPEALF